MTILTMKSRNDLTAMITAMVTSPSVSIVAMEAWIYRFHKIASLPSKGMTTRQISDTLIDIYGFGASEGFISDVTDKIMPLIEDWQNRLLSEVYPALYIDAIHYSVRDNGIICKLAAYWSRNGM